MNQLAKRIKQVNEIAKIYGHDIVWASSTSKTESHAKCKNCGAYAQVLIEHSIVLSGNVVTTFCDNYHSQWNHYNIAI